MTGLGLFHLLPDAVVGGFVIADDAVHAELESIVVNKKQFRTQHVRSGFQVLFHRLYQPLALPAHEHRPHHHHRVVDRRGLAGRRFPGRGLHMGQQVLQTYQRVERRDTCRREGGKSIVMVPLQVGKAARIAIHVVGNEPP